VKATHPMARMRTDEDYERGPPLMSTAGGHPVCKVRSAADAKYLLSLDDGGGVTQNAWVLAHMLREAGVPGIPPRHQDVHEIYQFAWGQGRCPVMGQPARHDLMIRYVTRYFGKAAVDLARPAIGELARKLLDDQIPGGSGILDVAAFARRLAFRATAVLAGFPCDPVIEGTFERMFDDFTLRPSVALLPEGDPAERAFLDGILRSGAGGLIADLIEAEAAGELSHVECLAMIRGAWYAGTDTTGATTATVLALFGDPAGRRWQEEVRSLAGAALRKRLRACALEAGRLWPTFPEIPMVTYQEVTLPSGYAIPAGTHILLEVSAINRDEPVAGNCCPEDFRPDLRRHRSLAFGGGLHACAGEYLALAVVEEGIRELVARTSWFSLPEDGWLSQSGLVTYIDRAFIDCVASSPA